MGEQTHFSGDLAKFSGKEGSLWAGGKPPVGRIEGNEDLKYAYQALPQPVISAHELGEQRQIHKHNAQTRGLGRFPSSDLSM